MIYYKKVGVGTPLIVMHGLFGTADNWRTFAGLLKDRYEMILVDLRNHGRSFWSDQYNYSLAAGDIIEVMDDLGLDRAHILGHSMGGKVGLTLAQKYPHRVDRLIIVDIGSKAYPRSHDEIFDAIFSIHPKQIDSRQEAEDKLSKTIKEKAVRQFLLKSLARDHQGGFRWKVNFGVLYERYQDILSEVEVGAIKAPTLFIRGSQSNYILDQDIDTLKANMSYTQVKVSTIDAGHWIHAERPMELLQEVVTFLK